MMTKMMKMMKVEAHQATLVFFLLSSLTFDALAFAFLFLQRALRGKYVKKKTTTREMPTISPT